METLKFTPDMTRNMKGTLFVEAPLHNFIKFCERKKLKFRGVGETPFADYKYLVVLDYQLGQTDMVIGIRASLKTAPKTYVPI